MRKLFTSLMALAATITLQAQEVDTSNWHEGDDVAAFLNWGDYDGTYSGGTTANGNGDYTPDDIGDYWRGSMPTEWNYLDDLGYGAYGYYFDGKASGPLTDVYQVVYFPAGWYTIQVQALYREGTPYDTFVNHFNHTPKKNAWLYANVLAGNDADAEVVDSYQQYVRSLATSEQVGERIFFDSDGSWKNDAEYEDVVYQKDANGEYIVDEKGNKIKDEEASLKYYCPCCLVGAINYFAQGRYENTLDIALTEGAYIRLGFKKTANIAQDWLVFTNFRIIYNGPVDDRAQLALALNEHYTAADRIEEASQIITDQGFEALATLINDKLMDIDGDLDYDSYEAVVAATAQVNALYDEAFDALQIANNLKDMLDQSQDILVSTDFDGKGTFQTTLDEITQKATTKDPADINYDINTYTELFNQLAKARADYLNTSPVDENGAKDFTSLIKYPWFVNPEYTPTLVNGHYELTENGWTAGANPTNYSSMKNGKTDIASKVVLSADEDATNQWYKFVNYSSGWSGGLNLYWQGHLIGVSDGWNSGLTGTMEIRQQLVGLPSGYYSLKGLVRGNGSGSWNDDNLPPYHNIFAQNSEEVIVKSPVGHTDSYYSPSYGWYEWNSNVWQEHKTSIIAVPDGRLLIGGQTSMIGNFTGFRLMFYGENPDFNGMIQEDLDDLEKEIASKIRFLGDEAVVRGIISEIQLPLPSTAEYEVALQLIRDARDYIEKAYQVTRNYNLGTEYDNLLASYGVEDPQADIVFPAVEFITELETSETTVYTDVNGLTDVYNAYKNYLSNYDKAITYDNTDLKAAIDRQTTALKAGYSDAETLNEYSTELNLLINIAAIIKAGGETASAESPADITVLINNPSFTTSPTNGWSGTSATSNEYARGNAEIWNASSIDFYQDIEGLPEGTYQINVRALYRDARNVVDNDNQSWTSYWTDANGDVDVWARHYSELYAKTATAESAAYVKSVCDGKFTEPSFSRYQKEIIEGDVMTDPETGEILYDPETGEELVERDTIWYYFNDTVYVADTEEIQDIKLHGYPFDETVVTDEGTYYYPSSMFGAYRRFLLSPEAYCNTVTIDVAAGETLRIGFRKSTSVSGDWLIFDDFQLLFLGGNLDSTGINDINVGTKGATAVYNLQGQQLAAPQRGINIIGGKKVLVK